jgi:hypothetical protein
VSFVTARRRQFCALACVSLFAACLLQYWVTYDSSDIVPRDPESFRLAHNLAEKGQFANPFVPLDTGPSAHLAPAFPAFLALLIRVFGDGSDGIYAIKWSAAILLSLQLALFPLFSKALGMGEFNGIVAAVLWIVPKVGIAFPPGRQPVVMFGWESFYTAILIAIAVCCFRRYLDISIHDTGLLSWAVGVVLGLLAVVSPPAGIIFMGYLAWMAWKDRPAIFRKSSLVVVLLPVLIVAPWLIRNYSVFNRIIFVRDNFGLELSVSNNDCAKFGIQQNFESGCFSRVHPNANIDEARKVLADGEPKYNDLKLRDARSWIENHPVQFLKLSGLRFVAFWFPPGNGTSYSLLGRGRRFERLTILIMTLLSVPGLFILRKQDRKSAVLCTVCLALFPLVYYVLQYEYRYRYPILWVTFLVGALPITTFMKHLLESFSYGRPIAE